MDEKRIAIQRQFQVNEEANILFAAAPHLLKIDSCFQDQLQQAKNEALSTGAIEALVEMAVRECIANVLRVNQYLKISEAARHRLADIYRRSWQLLQATDDVDLVLRTEHYPTIQAWLAELYPASLSKVLVNRPRIRPVHCSEYAAELQLAVLGLTIDDIGEPVLDVGCGFTAPLVRYLLAQGVEVYGFDRIVEKETPAVWEDDWFRYEFSVQRWGAIISHMALSNHFRYALHHDPVLKQELADVFRRLLSALRPGGCLAYAPSVEALERLVDRRTYRVAITPVGNGFSSTTIRRLGP